MIARDRAVFHYSFFGQPAPHDPLFEQWMRRFWPSLSDDGTIDRWIGMRDDYRTNAARYQFTFAELRRFDFTRYRLGDELDPNRQISARGTFLIFLVEMHMTPTEKEG